MKTLSWAAIFGAGALCSLGTMSLAQKGAGTALPRLSGLYRAFPSVAQFGAAVGKAYVFSPRGDVYKGWIGTQAPENFDFARARTREPGRTGKYVLSGDKITFRWSDGQSETASLISRRDPKSGKTTVSLGSSYCYKLIPWNRMVSGTFERSTYQGGFFDQNREHPQLIDRFTFSPDGRFTMIEDKTLPAVQGRYSVKGGALTLTLPDGKPRTYSLHVFEDHRQPPTAILIEGQPFLARTK